MAILKAIYDKVDEIPAEYIDLYSERNGKMELTGIENVKTPADVERVSIALRNEKIEHRKSKDQLAKFADIDPDQVRGQLEELETTKAQLGAFTKEGKLDETKLEPVITARVKAALGPVEHEKKALTKALEDEKKLKVEAEAKAAKLEGAISQNSISQAIREAATKLKLVPTAVDDAVMQGLVVLETNEDGEIVTKDVNGTTPGITPAEWLKDMQEKRPHWWPISQGSGARGGSGSPQNRADNPWTKEGWNLTKQGQIIRTQGVEKAKAMAASVGSSIGATSGAGKKAAKAANEAA
jgi:hypothetical protein